MRRALFAAAFAVVIAPVSAGWWLGSQNTLHLGYNEPAGKTATKKAELSAQFATNSVNLVQEVMTTSEMPNVTPGGYVYKVSALKGPSTYKEAYGFVYASSVSITGSLVNYPENGWDREPSGVRFWSGSSYIWCVSYHCPFETASMNFEIPAMLSCVNWYKAYASGVNDVIVGGDWNRASTHANFDTLEGGGVTSNAPNVPTTINTSGAWTTSNYDHFVWNPSLTSASDAARESITPAYWRANVSDHAGIYMWVNN